MLVYKLLYDKWFQNQSDCIKSIENRGNKGAKSLNVLSALWKLGIRFEIQEFYSTALPNSVSELNFCLKSSLVL